MKHTSHRRQWLHGARKSGGSFTDRDRSTGVQGRLKAKVFVAPSDSDDRLSFLRVCKMFHLRLKVRKKRKENKRRKDLRNPQRDKLWAFSYPSFFLFSFSTTKSLKVWTLNQHISTTWNLLEMQIIGLTSQLQNQRLGDGDWGPVTCDVNNHSGWVLHSNCKTLCVCAQLFHSCSHNDWSSASTQRL